jgi:choline-sulfatase
MHKRGRSIVIVIIIVLTGLLVTRILCPGQPQRPGKTPGPNVLVITIDTTRADHLGCYGNKHIRTPVLDTLAREGVLFEQAYSVQPVTLPVHTSILTGLNPYQHGVRDNNMYRLNETFVTLADRFKAAGYHTAAFISAFVLHRRFGLNQGFDLYNDVFIKPRQDGFHVVDRRASETSFLVGEWLKLNREAFEDAPFFLWIHYYDPHAPYDPPEPWASAYHDPYMGEIAFMDDWIGYVLDSLELEGFGDNTVIVVAGDHGESFGEYGEQTHGVFIYQPTIHVPFIMHYPAGLPRNIRIETPVSVVDIYPTLVDMMCWNLYDDTIGEGYPEYPGISLMDVIHGTAAVTERTLYRETYLPENFNWSGLAGIHTGDWLYIQAPRSELLPLDPAGKAGKDVIDSHPDKAAGFARTLTDMTGPDGGRREYWDVDHDTIQKLAALGYFVHPDAHHSAGKNDTPPDPKDNIHIFSRFQAAQTMVQQGHTHSAIPILNDLVKDDPGNPRMRHVLVSALMKSGDFETAKTTLENLLQVYPDDSEAHMNLGLCFNELGDDLNAIRQYRAVLAVDENSYLARFHLGLIYLNRNEYERAENEFLLCKAINDRDPAVYNNLGYIALKWRNDAEKGLEYLKGALELEPNNPLVLLSAGNACKNLGLYEDATSYLEQALAVSPDNPSVIDDLIDVYDARNMPSAADRLRQRKQLMSSTTGDRFSHSRM